MFINTTEALYLLNSARSFASLRGTEAHFFNSFHLVVLQSCSDVQLQR